MSTSFWQGLHFSRCRGVNSDMARVWRLPGGARRAIFSMILTFLHLKSHIFARPQGHLQVLRGPEGSRGGNRGGRVWMFSRKGSNFQGNFRNPVFLRGVRFPMEFLETCSKAKAPTRLACIGEAESWASAPPLIPHPDCARSCQTDRQQAGAPSQARSPHHGPHTQPGAPRYGATSRRTPTHPPVS